MKSISSKVNVAHCVGHHAMVNAGVIPLPQGSTAATRPPSYKTCTDPSVAVSAAPCSPSGCVLAPGGKRAPVGHRRHVDVEFASCWVLNCVASPRSLGKVTV